MGSVNLILAVLEVRFRVIVRVAAEDTSWVLGVTDTMLSRHIVGTNSNRRKGR